MADTTAFAQDAPAKPSKKPLILGLLLALVLGGGGFYAVWSGLILPQAGPDDGNHGHAPPSLAQVAFVPLEPLLVTLGPDARSRHLRFAATLEVDPLYQAEVDLLRPRILDVFNSYLRAVDVAELEQPSTLIRLRAQLLRRVQLVTGEGRVRDLLVTEFVLN